LSTAYELLAKLEQEAEGPEEAMPRFLYVFSDRTEACWDGRQLESLKRQRDRIPAPEVHAVFVDVGIDSPADMAITDLTLPRQAISPRDRVIIRATVRATGTDVETEAVCEIDGTVVDKRLVKLAAGQSEVVSFERGDLPLGLHQAVVSLKTEDATLGFNDKRYVTFEVRSPRRVLTIVDHKTPGPQYWTEALNIKSLSNFECDEKPLNEIDPLGPADLENYRAITLLGVARPSPDLWEKLQRFVRKGGGLAVIPGGQEMDRRAYNNDYARVLLPARVIELLKVPKPPKGEPGLVITWNWEKASSHPLLAPFQRWRRETNVDFFQSGKSVYRYWKVEPQPGAASEIISYTDRENLPALLERHFEDKSTHGKVLLFTTALDNDNVDPASPDRMNDYLEMPVSFFLALAQKAVGYLTGDAEEATFNYKCGQAVPVPLPGDSRLASYTLVGPPGALSATEAIINRAENESELIITKAVKEGNYKVVGDGKEIAAFSLNVSPEESVLDRVPPEKIEALFGEGALLPLDAKTNLREALQGHWSQPIELLPWLMILILLVLAVENLLANKFYRREPEENEKVAALQPAGTNQ
jgi:hypothetical protein